MALQTPVVFFTFRRPEVTARVFEAIAAARPQTLLVVGDGARPHKPGEAELVARTRDIINRVDWNCNVRTNFATENLGCKQRIVTGLAWVFQQTDQAIFLEDDCLPNPTFFNYCQELLERYRDNPRIVAISGSNLQMGRSRTSDSYYFSKYFNCWGWASWRRVWQAFDPDLATWPQFLAEGNLDKIADTPQEVEYWQRIFERQHRGEIDSWAFSWLYSCWALGGLTIVPNVNLMANVGFGEGATHTSETNSALGNLRTSALRTLRHPHAIERQKHADVFTFRNYFQHYSRRGLSGILHRILRTLQRPLERKVKSVVDLFAK